MKEEEEEEEETKTVYIITDNTGYKVYGKEKDALAATGIEDSEEITSVDEDNMFNGERCTRMHIGIKSTHVFILHILEDGEGESYHCETWESAHQSEKDMLSSAVEFYDNEHNREDDDDRCKRCAIDENECKKRFISQMKGKGYSKISPNIIASSFKVDITQ